MRKVLAVVVLSGFLVGCVMHPPNHVTKQEALDASVYRHQVWIHE